VAEIKYSGQKKVSEMVGQQHFRYAGGRNQIMSSFVQCADDLEVYSKHKKSYWRVSHRAVID
jgi:hypothetical protein